MARIDRQKVRQDAYRGAARLQQAAYLALQDYIERNLQAQEAPEAIERDMDALIATMVAEIRESIERGR